MKIAHRSPLLSIAYLTLSLAAGGGAAIAAVPAAPVVSLVANATNFDLRGGSVGFTAAFDCSGAHLGGLSLEVALPEGWSVAGTTGSSLPGIAPQPGATGKVGWAYISIPEGATGFSFTVDYPAGLSGAQVLTASTYAFLSAGDQIPMAPTDIVIAAPGQVQQTITFPPLPDCDLAAGPALVTAVASSGLPMTLTVVGGPAKIEGNVLTVTGTGSVAVQAAQAGTGVFAPAPRIQRSFSVSAAAGPKS